MDMICNYCAKTTIKEKIEIPRGQVLKNAQKLGWLVGGRWGIEVGENLLVQHGNICPSCRKDFQFSEQLFVARLENVPRLIHAEGYVIGLFFLSTGLLALQPGGEAAWLMEGHDG